MSLADAAVDDPVGRRLRHRLVDELVRSGRLRSPGWQDAFRRVPRHLFLPMLFRPDGAGGYQPVDGSSPEHRPEWFRLVYSDEAWVTQLDGDRGPRTAREAGRVTGTPTCSSTQPTLMVTMLEALDVGDADRVLEIGTGTGYNAALLCERLGSPAVASVDVDPGLVDEARQRLIGLGYAPVLAAADGARGLPDHGPYDRIVATVSVPAIPGAWLRQTRPGGLILASLDRGLGGGALVRLMVGPDDSASGHFLPDYGSFMPLRAIRRRSAPSLLHDVDETAGQAGPAQIGGSALKDPDFLFLVGLLVPEVARVAVAADNAANDDVESGDGEEINGSVERPPAQDDLGWQFWLVGQDGSWAHDDAGRGGGAIAVQAGARRLWDELEAAHAAWDSLGRPPRYRFGLTVTADGANLLWFDRPTGERSWELHTS